MGERLTSPSDRAEIAIIGGSGLYEPGMLENTKEIKVYTPFGKPSDFIILGTLHGRHIAFLSRHGRGHQLPAHLVNYRANIWALKELGVSHILASNACGSLCIDFKPGDMVIIDQFIDKTKLRHASFYEGGQVCHISVADPFCDALRRLLIEAGKELKIPLHENGTYICIEGPRFSTKAESKMFRALGADVVGMTLVPECVLAREAQICYAPVALVTDYDCWKEHTVDLDTVIKTMNENVHKTKQLFANVIKKIPTERTCKCKDALKTAVI